MVGRRSELYKNHPDWVLKFKNGEKIKPWKMYNEPKVWGYQDEEYYVLDTSNKQALSHIKNVFVSLKEMGAELFKTDFMTWGIKDSSEVDRAEKGKTSVEYYREFMSVIRESIKDSYWLGCIAPMLPSLGFVNGIRIAGDVGAQWEDGAEFGPTNMINQTVGENYVNGIYWQNDPDSIILRDYHVYLKDNEIKSLALLQALSGGMVYTSETLHKLPKERIDLFRFIKPDSIIRKPNVPFLDNPQKIVVLHHNLGKKHIVLLFNPTNETQNIIYSCKELTGAESLYFGEWKSEKLSDLPLDTVAKKIDAHSAVLLFASVDKDINTNPDNVWKF